MPPHVFDSHILANAALLTARGERETAHDLLDDSDALCTLLAVHLPIALGREYDLATLLEQAHHRIEIDCA